MIDAILNSRRFQNIIAMMKMKAAQGIPAFQSDTPRIVAKRHRRSHWQLPHQSVNEMARRRRQIERGQLTASNGLVIPRTVSSAPWKTWAGKGASLQNLPRAA